jgi:hypothetical protein
MKPDFEKALDEALLREKKLQAEAKKLKTCLDCLSNLVIFQHPETWEQYLEDIKQALAQQALKK